MTEDPTRGTEPEEQLRRSKAEIAQLLGVLATRKALITADLEAGALRFTSKLRAVDPVRACIFLEPDADEAINAALLSRPRCIFHGTLPGGVVEFAAADPQKTVHEGAPAIRLKFPEVLARHQRRDDDRMDLETQVPLVCVADDGGVLSFKGGLIDISVNGLGFLIYDPKITLEPGTVLKGCRIDPDNPSPLILDLEVRHSELISLPDGTRAERSGCRVVSHPETLKEFVAALSK